jgi:hypothetical protein
MKTKNPQMKDLELTDELFDRCLGMSAVDCVPLLVNKKATDFIAINLYVDDQGVAKKLPVNVRATQICQAANKRLQVNGDAFISRYFDNDDEFYRYDFTLSDLKSDAQWMKLAKQFNAADASPNADHSASIQKVQLINAGKHVCGLSNCVNEGKLRCSRCKSTFYCSPEHQKNHWKDHKGQCVAPTEAKSN